jgi:hypothetical protein
MKIAVCFSGQFRTARECASNLKAFFSSDEHEVDFFIHTWDNTSYKNFNATNIYPRRDRYLTEDDIEFLKETYNPKYIKIESHFDYLKKYVNKGFGNGLELWYSFYKSITLKKLYERKHNFKYDVVIKVRLDCMFANETFENHINLVKNSTDNTIFTHFSYGLNWKNHLKDITANDIYFISTSQTMDEYAKFFVDKMNYDKNNPTSICENDGYGYTQNMHTFFKKLEAKRCYDNPFVLRDAYKELAKLSFDDDNTFLKMEAADGYYYTHYKTIPNQKCFVKTLPNEYRINLDDMYNKIYLDEIDIKPKFTMI